MSEDNAKHRSDRHFGHGSHDNSNDNSDFNAVPMFERQTAVSRNVVTVLEKAGHPLSVSQIMESLEDNGLTPSKTTIYRILEKLADKQRVTEISARNGLRYFEFLNQNQAMEEHHHHFVCTVCKKMFCLDTCHVVSHGINLSSLLPNRRFKIVNHDFNLYGVCERCASKES